MLFERDGIEWASLEQDRANISMIKEKSFELLIGTLLLAYPIYHNNRELILPLLKVISDHANRVFTGIMGRKKVKVDLLVETDGNKTTKKISLDGEPEEILKLDSYIQQIMDEKPKDEKNEDEKKHELGI